MYLGKAIDLTIKAGRIKIKKEEEMKVGLYTTSYNGLFFKGGPVPLKECIYKAAEFGFDGIEFEGKRPHASPLDLDKDDRKELKDLVQSKGLEIAAVSAYNNFASPVMIQRENELLMLREVIKLASDLGTRIVRIFAAWRGWTLREGHGTYDMVFKYEHPDVTRLQKWNWCKECIKESAKYAEDLGVTLALQNHPPLIESYQDALDMVNEVGSDYVKCCMDPPLFKSQEDEYVAQAILATGNLQVHCHFGGEYEKNSEGKVVQRPIPSVISGMESTPLANYPAAIKALKEVGYEGYLSFELCHPFMPKNHEFGSVADVDEVVKCALAYMRNLTQE